MIATLLLVLHASAAPQYGRPRAQYLAAVWAAEHGDVERARTAARAVLWHDPTAAAPRVLLAKLLPDDPASVSEATALLEAAARSEAAPAAVFTALGQVHVRAGRTSEAEAAFAGAHARGGGPDNDAAWLLVLNPTEGPRLPAAIEVSARWQASPNPGSGGYALRAQRALAVDDTSARRACLDALAAAELAEPLSPRLAAERCRAAGLQSVGALALSRLQGASPEELQAARQSLGAASP